MNNVDFLSTWYSFPNKQKNSESSPAAAMNSSLGNNLSELDRLLLELNAVQQSTPAFPIEGTLQFSWCLIFLSSDVDVTT